MLEKFKMDYDENFNYINYVNSNIDKIRVHLSKLSDIIGEQLITNIDVNSYNKINICYKSNVIATITLDFSFDRFCHYETNTIRLNGNYECISLDTLLDCLEKTFSSKEFIWYSYTRKIV